MHNPPETRLDRIEQKIDKLADAIVALARVEEKIVQLEKSNSATATNQADLDDRLTALEISTIAVKSLHGNLSKFLWTVVGGSATATVWWFITEFVLKK